MGAIAAGGAASTVGNAAGRTAGSGNTAPNAAGSIASIRAVNAKLMQSERQLLDPAGLPHREWYRHLLYAPGFYTGYDVKTLPGVREGIDQRQYAEADVEIARAAKMLDRETALVDAATAELARLGPPVR